MIIREILPEHGTGRVLPEHGAGRVTGVATPGHLENLVARFKTCYEKDGASCLNSDFVSQLRLQVTDLSQASDLSTDAKKELWQHAHTIWNMSVDIVNKKLQDIDENHARIRHIACDLLLIAGELENDVQGSQRIMVNFLLKTGKIWHDCMNFELAEACFETATELGANFADDGAKSNEDLSKGDHRIEEQQLMFSLYTSRAKTAFELSQRTLVCNLLGRARSIAAALHNAENYVALGQDYVQYGRLLLEKGTSDAVAESTLYMENAYEICSSAINEPEFKGRSKLICSLQEKVLRFLATSHFENGNYERVLKCTSLSKEMSTSSRLHPGVTFLSLKALANLGKCKEAAEELETLVANKLSGLDMCLSGLLSLASLDNIPVVFLLKAIESLRSRFPEDPQIIISCIERISNRPLTQEREDFILNLCSDEVIIKLFEGAGAQDEVTADNNAQQCMNLLLWNIATNKYNNHEYTGASKLFEAALFYVPVSSPGLKAKTLRILALCHINMHDHERASEYIDSAQKLDPSMAGAYIKFFNLACHEAEEKRFTELAVIALSKMLRFYNSERKPATKEIIVLRNLIRLHESQGNKAGMLETYKRAQARLKEQGRTFLGGLSCEREEAEWFAITSYSQGVQAGKKNEWDLAAGFLSCAVDFFEANPLSVENIKRYQNALLLQGSALLQSGAKKEEELKLASACLDKLNKKCKTTPGILADHFLQIANSVVNKDNYTYEIACMAYRAHLEMTLQGASPNYGSVASVMRQLISLSDKRCRDGPDVLRLYKEASQILMGLLSNAYPLVEVDWLISTAWNRASFLVKFSRLSEAESWMRVAMELLKHSPTLEASHKGSMEEALQDVLGKKGNAMES